MTEKTEKISPLVGSFDLNFFIKLDRAAHPFLVNARVNGHFSSLLQAFTDYLYHLRWRGILPCKLRIMKKCLLDGNLLEGAPLTRETMLALFTKNVWFFETQVKKPILSSYLPSGPFACLFMLWVHRR